ncbi:MAG: alpha/beta hydrolase [Trebonia sp.]|jgi:pimeloyl-ACP methyl ester carboxylesterase
MAVDPEEFTELGDEFALIPQTGAEAGIAGGEAARVRRGWVNVPAGGHVSGVFWGDGPPELVLLHDSGESARVWDAVALALGRPLVAIDLPGHGRSDWRRDGRYQPALLASAVAEAIRSFAPRARLVAGTGLGGLAALALRRRHARLLPGLALVNTLPGTVSGRAWTRSEPERYASRAAALAALASRRPEASGQALRREVLYELLRDPDGSWVWRHHPGNLPAAPDQQLEPAEDPLWSEFAQLQVPATLIRGDWAGPLVAADLASLRQRLPHIRVITVPGAGVDIAATQPAALAAALDHLLITDQVRQ